MQREWSAPAASDEPQRIGVHDARRPQALDALIGQTLREHRQALNMSQQALADRCHLSFQQIQKYEAGTNRIPASRLFDLAVALETTPTTLLLAASGRLENNEDGELRNRLSLAANGLSGDALRALVTVAERLTSQSN